MRILVVNQYFHPDVASTSQILTELCEDLGKQHDVTVVAGRPSYNPAERLATKGLVTDGRHGNVRVLRTWSTAFDRSRMAGRLTNYATYLASCLVGAVQAGRPDVIVTMTDPPVVAAVAAAVSRARRVPFVYINQDVFPQVALALGRLRPGVAAGALSRFNGSLRRSAERVVSIGRDMARRLEEQGCPREKIEVIPNWADGSAIRPVDDRDAVKASFGWEGRFVVMHSGNVGLSQNLDVLIEAASLLQDHSEIHIAIVGEGASKERLERRAAALALSNVSFLPYQAKSSLSRSLGAGDVHLVSLKRGLRGYIVPSKVYGIMAAGRPFIAALDRGSEVALLAEEHRCGFLVAPDDPQRLADAIVRIRSEPLDEIGRRGREALDRHYDRAIATARYRELLERVVTAGGGGTR